MAKTEQIELIAIEPQSMTITLTGTSDLVLNQMNAVNRRALTTERENKTKEVKKVDTKWEQIITAIHWEDPLNEEHTEFSEETMHKLLKDNKPCISAFGLKQSFKQAVTRNGVSTYSTEFDATVNVVAPKNGMFPIIFSEWAVDSRLMSPKRGAPVLCHLNHFIGWSCDIRVDFLTSAYSRDQIVNIINLAGFGIGIGSGRSSGYGRYKVTNVQG